MDISWESQHLLFISNTRYTKKGKNEWKNVRSWEKLYKSSAQFSATNTLRIKKKCVFLYGSRNSNILCPYCFVFFSVLIWNRKISKYIQSSVLQTTIPCSLLFRSVGCNALNADVGLLRRAQWTLLFQFVTCRSC